MSKITYSLKDKHGHIFSPTFGSYDAVIEHCDIEEGSIVVQIKEIELTYKLTVTLQNPIDKYSNNAELLHVEYGKDRHHLDRIGHNLRKLISDQCNNVSPGSIHCKVVIEEQD